MSSLADGLAQTLQASPLASALAALLVAWGVAHYFYHGRGVTISSPGNSVSREEAMRMARERQQVALAAAGQQQQRRPGKSPAVTRTQPAPEAPQDEEPMPARMKAAIERRADAPPSAAAAAPNGDRAAYLKSVADRFAKIEAGKGPSAHNPLDGQGDSGSSCKFTSKKKGG